MLKEEKFITLKDGNTLFASIVETGSPVWLILTHGLGEHSERHKYIYKLFSQYFNICLYDLRGHGRSTGKRAYVDHFSQYTCDLEEVLAFLQNDYAMDRFQLIGHSMGGLVVADYLQNYAQDHFYPDKVFLSAPATGGAGFLGQIMNYTPLKIMQGLKSLPTSIALKGLIDVSKLSHDPRVYEAYVTDDLNSMKVHTKLVFEILHKARKVFSRPLRAKCDLYCALGSDDQVVNPGATLEYFQDVEKNVNLKVIEGGYHELHNEIAKYREPYLEFLKNSIMEEVFS
ncbi:MAG: hypothetical protein CME62_11265 [Halobacteriovoraceae bacterium]|nr:hypothetical protein [Halobacteriovoraceae bacterium]|tara:strand:+ start:9573 stop:10427 length:855 start_codon:yes stop_codon:yes gene_type:complete